MALEGKEESNGKARAEDGDGERYVRRGQHGEHEGAGMPWHGSKDAALETQQSPGCAQEHLEMQPWLPDLPEGTLSILRSRMGLSMYLLSLTFMKA